MHTCAPRCRGCSHAAVMQHAQPTLARVHCAAVDVRCGDLERPVQALFGHLHACQGWASPQAFYSALPSPIHRNTQSHEVPQRFPTVPASLCLACLRLRCRCWLVRCVLRVCCFPRAHVLTHRVSKLLCAVVLACRAPVRSAVGNRQGACQVRVQVKWCKGFFLCIYSTDCPPPPSPISQPLLPKPQPSHPAPAPAPKTMKHAFK